MTDVRWLAILDGDHLAWTIEGQLDIHVVDRKGSVLHRLRAANRSGVKKEGVTALAGTASEVVGAANGAIRTWNAKTGHLVRELWPEDPIRIVGRLAQLPDGSLMALVTPDRRDGYTSIDIHRWAPDGTALPSLPLPMTQRWAYFASGGDFAMSPDRQKIATGVDQIATLDARTNRLICDPFGGWRDQAGDAATVLAHAWYEDGPVACMHVGFIGDALEELHVVDGRGTTARFGDHRGGVLAAALLGDRRLVTAGRVDQRVAVRELDGTATCELTGAEGRLRAMAAASDGSQVVAATDHQVLVWDLAGCPR